MSQPRLVIGYVRGDTVEGAFKDSLDNFAAFDARNRRVGFAQGFTKGPFVDDNRNELVRDMLDSPGDYFLMIDTDIEFQPLDVYALLDEAVAHDREILSGMYYSFIVDGKLRPVWFNEGERGGPVVVYHRFDPAEIVVPLAACGMGFCLIRRSVFEKMLAVPEWAADSWTWFGRDRYRTPENTIKHHGEDICFCLRADKIRIQTWGHKGVVVKHWKKIPLDEMLFEAMFDWYQKRELEY